MQSQASSSLPFALLCPVPRQHLVSAVEDNLLLQVTFGSNAWEFFRKVDDERKNPALHVDVFVYASWQDAGQPFVPEATWRGVYVKHLVASDPRQRREAMRYRPSSTQGETGWTVYWLVEDLQELPESQHIEISTLRGWRTQKTYSRNFIPSGPLLIEHPGF